MRSPSNVVSSRTVSSKCTQKTDKLTRFLIVHCVVLSYLQNEGTPQILSMVLKAQASVTITSPGLVRILLPANPCPTKVWSHAERALERDNGTTTDASQQHQHA